ncbi:SirB1 family protein [Roseateles koreensis]|uniref:Tetratricopeptide repeat protein n=1 Tax=Roseateles koreensis TaxID=2987526 RepID=A0ABT5KUB9_9BURK|nr:tetratricopeptide repeat protein [Roseateles koreensis]MDC8786035.1 tetratricopeptide repeat protein [Roseateles koreensis]
MPHHLRLHTPSPLEYFSSLVAEDAGLNLLEAAIAIAQDEVPTLDVQAALAEIDAMAQRLRARLPSDASARHKLQMLNRYFYEELGFGGNINNYYESGNSFVHHVLATRRGIPITLALIFNELATQIGLRVQGLAFPGHFLIKLLLGNGELVLDPFTGKTLSRNRLDEFLQAFRQSSGLTGAVDLPVELFMQAAEPREILARMLRNLKEIHRAADDLPRMLAVQQRLVVLLPNSAAERRDRGLVLEALGHWQAAAEDLDFYLQHEPQAQDRLRLKQRLAQLQARGAPPLH